MQVSTLKMEDTLLRNFNKDYNTAQSDYPECNIKHFQRRKNVVPNVSEIIIKKSFYFNTT